MMRKTLGIVAGSALLIGLVAPAASAQVPPVGLPELPDTGLDVPGLEDLDLTELSDLGIDLVGLEMLAPLLECASTDALGDLPDAGEVPDVTESDVGVGVLLCVIEVAVGLLGEALAGVGDVADVPEVPDVVPEVPAP